MGVPRLPGCTKWDIVGLRSTWETQEFHWFVPCLCFCVVAVDMTDPLAEPLLSERGGATRIGKFHEPQDGDSADLSPLLEDTMQLRKEVPLELVVNMFRKLVSFLYFDY